MLFILGTKSYNSNGGEIDNFNCPKCFANTKLNYIVSGRYTFLTFIPLFPVDKEILIFCDHCDEVIQYHQLEENTKNEIKRIKKESILPAPFWTYTGSIALAGALFFGIYSYVNSNNNSKIYLQNPMVGDVYNVKMSNGFYTTYRIDKMSKDSIFVTVNDYQAYLPYETDDIDTPENYTDTKTKYSKQDIANLFNKDEIYSITRKE
ncbi:hypothetical protein [Flavobacterium sp.]|uniref:hypothetical protein n=1 Tax=Flavobacterium sp. TaxID=239 RepID=UPI00391D3187